jgi:predicted NBD/HSP70 family sugar kinase
MKKTISKNARPKFGYSGSTAVAKIFGLIRNNGAISRQGLEELTGISRSAIALHINALRKLGLINKIGGRRGNSFTIKGVDGCFVGVDLDRTTERVSVGLFDVSMDLVDQTQKVYPWHALRPEKVMDQVIVMIQRLLTKNSITESRLWGIGVSVPVPVNPRTGEIAWRPYLGMTHDSGFKKLASAFSCPVRVENDANVMALAEKLKGQGRGVQDFVFLHCCFGIGAGIIMQGELCRGWHGYAGEVGHIFYEKSDKSCICGNRGCVVAEAGSGAILSEAVELAKRNKETHLARQLEKNKVITLKDIGVAAGLGDEVCIDLVKKTGDVLGAAVSGLVNVLNPELVIIGGPTTDLGEILLTSLRQSLIHRSMPSAASELVIKRTTLGDSIGMIGAAYMVEEEVLSSTNVAEMIDRYKAPSRSKKA